MPAAAHHRLRRQTGVSLVELLIGLTIGLFIVGAGLTVFVVHLRESRALISESRLMQDLRAATDLMARDLRRAGYWANAEAGVWQRDLAPDAGSVAANPYTTIMVTGTATPAITYRFSRDAAENDRVDDNEQFGYRLRSGALEMQLGSGHWQALTDVTSMKVTQLLIAHTNQVLDLENSCQLPCPVHSATCPPRLHVRSVSLTVSARNANDPTATERTVRTGVRLRNDEITGRCPA